MAKAKKLPSGSWRVQVFSYTDANGKKHRESFTAPTKAEAELMASEYKAKKHRIKVHDLTVKDAVEGYIRAKETVLSPSTLREYRRMLKSDFGGIMNKRIRKLTSEDMQLYVSDLARSLSPKTVRNRYGLLTASIGLYSPDMTFKVTFPAKEVKRSVLPSDDDVSTLYQTAPYNLKLVIGLAICGLRRGEICALKYEDIKDGVAHVHADIVQGKNREWIYKPIPKTDGSDRYVRLPDSIIRLIGNGKDQIIIENPNQVGQAFKRHAKNLGIDVHLHQLRHFYASTGAVLQIPDIFLADMGGWRHSSKVMKDTYQNTTVSMADYYFNKMNTHLDKILEGE